MVASAKSFRLVFIALSLAVAVVVCSIVVVHLAYLNRGAWNQLQAARVEQQQLQIQWGQLLLQQGMLADPVKIERQAHQKLAMEIPRLSKVVVVK